MKLVLLLTLSATLLIASDVLENLSSLRLRDSHLEAVVPVVGERDTLPDFTREMVRVQWRPDDPIYLFVVRPKLTKRPPIILYLYGFPAETDRFMDNEFCKLLVKDGFAAVGFVSALTGHRYHDRPMKEWFVSELKESLPSSVHDVEMILNYLDTRTDLDSKRMGMFGEGSGGTIAILAAASDSRLRAIDLLDPWGDWPDWMAHSTLVPEDERTNYLQPEFLKNVERFDPLRWFPTLTSVPVRFQYLTKPSTTPQIVRARMEKALPPQAMIIPLEKALAAYRASDGNDFFDWLKERVR